MDFTRECLYFKVKSIASTLYGIMLWASSYPSPMQPTKYENFGPHKNHSYFSLVAQNTPPRILHSYMIPSKPLLPPSPSLPLFSLTTSPSTSSWSTSSMGDLIGTESGIYTSPDQDIITKESEIRSELFIQACKKKKRKKNEYPRPIPSIARTGNLYGRMPWVLIRHYVNGRLIIKMHQVNRHEYFETNRSNGRLILKLMPLDKYEDDVDMDYEHKLLGEGGSQRKKTVAAPLTCSLPKSCGETKWSKSGDSGCARMCFTYAGEPTDFGLRRVSNANTIRGNVAALTFNRVAPVATVM